jgi:hypothetical protein
MGIDISSMPVRHSASGTATNCTAFASCGKKKWIFRK